MTLHEPTADQKAAVKKYEKTTKIVSFDELRSLLFDAQGYLRIRAGKSFGSVYDHAIHSFEVPRSEFVEPTIISMSDSSTKSLRVPVDSVLDSGRTIITAEYGIGKSMLLREIFFHLLKDFSQGKTFRFPVAINLREHMGQDDPVELLERHARNNAADPRKLVAAWGAGYVDLIIDGFDELSTRGWTGDHRKLREFKRSTHSVVKKLIKDTPIKASILISGRAAYFDSESEMREALGVPEGRFDHLVVHPFDSVQAIEYLKKKNCNDSLPQWLPTRPLFLSYLINKNLIKEAVSVSSSGSFPEGTAWCSLLRMIAERESDQSEGVDKESILQFWGILATKARQGSSLQKSFSPTEMDEAFYAATGNNVSEDERRLLLRLPGFGISPDSASSRIFIDNDFLNAASANLVFSHIKFPYGEESYRDDIRGVTQQFNQVGTHVICSSIENEKVSIGLLEACLSNELSDRNYGLAYDLFMPLVYLGRPTGYMLFEGIDLQEIDLCQDIWEEVKVDFSNCIISNLVLPPDGDISSSIHFSECLIGNIEGRSSEKDIPDGVLINCEIDKFAHSYDVNNNILESELPIDIRVLVVTLIKVYLQAGSSRLEALYCEVWTIALE